MARSRPKTISAPLAFFCAGVLLTAPFAQPARAQGPEAVQQETFASPKEAFKALKAATAAVDESAMAALFGPEYRDLLSGDAAQDQEHLEHFARALAERMKPEREGTGKIILYVGRKDWPFPIPLVRTAQGWRFDTAAGKEEIIDRRVGKDELDAIGVCRAYAKGAEARRAAFGPDPVHGYYFRLLDADKSGGFVLLAYPETWDRSGVMTFLVGRDGVVYRRNLGQETARLAAAMTRFDAAEGWRVETERGTDIAFRDAGKSR